jgi:hypothetical protein
MVNLIKFILPFTLLCCKAKIENNKQVITKNVVTCKTDTSEYHWSNEFSDSQLRELCENGNLVINNK